MRGLNLLLWSETNYFFNLFFPFPKIKGRRWIKFMFSCFADNQDLVFLLLYHVIKILLLILRM